MKDETTGTPQDPLQPPGQASVSGEGITPPEPETYTKDQAQKMVSDALAAKGRDARSLEQRETAIKDREETVLAEEAEIAQRKRENDAADLAEARRDPAKMRDYQTRKTRETSDEDIKAERVAIKKDRAQLEKDKAEHAGELGAAREEQRAINIWKIADKHGVSAAALKDLGIDDMDALEKIAAVMAGGKGQQEPDSHLKSGKQKDLTGLSPRAVIQRGLDEQSKQK